MPNRGRYVSVYICAYLNVVNGRAILNSASSVASGRRTVLADLVVRSWEDWCYSEAQGVGEFVGEFAVGSEGYGAGLGDGEGDVDGAR